MKTYRDPSFDTICGGDIAYGFFGRTGGVSEGVYDSLNCAPNSGDDLAKVAENRRRVAFHIAGENAPLVTLKQCHSALAHYIDAPYADGMTPEGDSLVTDQPGLIVACLTADCGPVLFKGAKADGAPVIGAAHAGWGGALGGVLESTVQVMLQTGASIESIRACVGPCMLQASYEVKEDFAKPFLLRDEEAEHFFKSAAKSGHLMFDLPGYIALRLSQTGVRHVALMGLDTYANGAAFFSFRRATHEGVDAYGREISAIMIRP